MNSRFSDYLAGTMFLAAVLKNFIRTDALLLCRSRKLLPWIPQYTFLFCAGYLANVFCSKGNCLPRIKSVDQIGLVLHSIYRLGKFSRWRRIYGNFYQNFKTLFTVYGNFQEAIFKKILIKQVKKQSFTFFIGFIKQFQGLFENFL